MVNCSQHRVYGLGNCLDTALLYTYLPSYLVDRHLALCEDRGHPTQQQWLIGKVLANRCVSVYLPRMIAQCVGLSRR